jgi:acetoacetyl-CoA synthetase
MTALLAQLGEVLASPDYAGLHAFSVAHPTQFWAVLWDFLAIVGDRGDLVVEDARNVAGARWFPRARLNFAENHLRRRDDAPALIAIDETDGRRTVSWWQLYADVQRARAALRRMGIGPGDRVASLLPNIPETVIACLAATSLGAVWSACAPEYGEEAILDRFVQIEPSLLLLCDGYRYAGKAIDMAPKNAALVRALPSAQVVQVGGAGEGALAWAALIAGEATDEPFERFGFDQPCYILFSSGTTGKPKAIVHSAGGALLQSVKEMVLHCDCRSGEPIFWPTNPGWMVWNVMLGGLAAGAPLVLYEGAPTWPTQDRMFAVMAQEGVGVARLTPPLLDAYRAAGLSPGRDHDLTALRCLVSGSAPLLAHHYAYVLAHVKADLHVASPAGGTDVMGALATGNPIGPVYAGEIQCRSLGMAVEVWNEAGQSVVGEEGELVCTRAFPSVPLAFWGDEGGERLHETYFATFPGVWRHGDWAEITSRGGVIIHGRADATLKVRGVRIGAAEIYRAMTAVPEVKDAVAVLHGRAGSEKLILFVTPQDGRSLDEAVAGRIRQAIRAGASPRHVPDWILAAPDLLRSLNGKPAELAIKAAVNGRPVTGRLGLSNPELIPHFEAAGRSLAAEALS